MTETLVRQRVEDWARAVRAEDIDVVLSLYATNNISFDLDPPLPYAGADNKRQAWQKFFAARTGPIGYEVSELASSACCQILVDTPESVPARYAFALWRFSCGWRTDSLRALRRDVAAARFFVPRLSCFRVPILQFA